MRKARQFICFWSLWFLAMFLGFLASFIIINQLMELG